jgi:hypothetical protein
MVFGIIPERRSASLRNKRSASPESPRKQLAVEKDSWARLSGAVNLIFEEGSR